MSILLGILDEPVGVHATSMLTNKIGGCPDGENVQEMLSFAKCPVCGNQLVHITQIYCPLTDSPYHRTLNLFCCAQKACWNNSLSWKIFRRQWLDKEPSTTVSPERKKDAGAAAEDDDWGVGQDDWGVGQDDWGDGSNNVVMATNRDLAEDDVGYESNDEALPCKEGMEGLENSVEGDSSSSTSEAEAAAAQMQQLLIADEDDGEMQECVPEDMQPPNPAVFQEILHSKGEPLTVDNIVLEPYFVSVVDEPQRAQTDFRHEERLLAKYRAEQGFDEEEFPSKKGASSGGEEKYEKTSAKHGDVTFYKFLKKLESQPDQILRYAWNGKPLHISARQDTTVPNCQQCNHPRIFELQLMPSLIPQMKCPLVQGAVVEYGTVLVYVCEQSCWTNDQPFVEEFVQVEAEPDLHFFKK